MPTSFALTWRYASFSPKGEKGRSSFSLWEKVRMRARFFNERAALESYSRARVRGSVRFLQSLNGNVCVNLRRRQTRVSEQRLDAP